LGTPDLFEAVSLPGRKTLAEFCGGLCISRESRDNVYPIKRTEMVEMDDMIMNCMGTHDNVSDVLGIEWNFHAECIFYGTH
jgi:hypothetical protein